MRIRPLPTRKQRTEAVHYGEKSRGKRRLVNAVMEAGYSRRIGEKAVNAVINAWKNALASGVRKIEMPLGNLVVKKTPKHLYKRRLVANRVGNRALGNYHSWTVYNDRYRVLWRVPQEQWAEVIDGLNPGLTAEPVEGLKLDPKPGKTGKTADVPVAPVPAAPQPGQHPPGMVMIAPRTRPVPSRTEMFRRR